MIVDWVNTVRRILASTRLSGDGAGGALNAPVEDLETRTDALKSAHEAIFYDAIAYDVVPETEAPALLVPFKGPDNSAASTGNLIIEVSVILSLTCGQRVWRVHAWRNNFGESDVSVEMVSTNTRPGLAMPTLSAALDPVTGVILKVGHTAEAGQYDVFVRARVIARAPQGTV